MSELDDWLKANDHFLADSLAQLRDRLARVTPPAASAATPVPAPPPTSPPSLMEHLFRRRAATQPPLPQAQQGAPAAPLAAPGEAGLPAESAATATPAAPRDPPALTQLAERLGLNAFERDLLFLCAAVELDSDLPALLAGAQGDRGRTYPTFALARRLFDAAGWEVMAPERPLRYWRLLEISQPGAQPLITSALKADERIVSYLQGLNYLDDRLGAYLSPAPEVADLPPSQAALADAVLARIDLDQAGASLPLLQLAGSDSASKLAVAALAADRLGLSLYRMAADSLPSALADQDHLLRLWQRECALMPVALYVDASRLEAGGAQALAWQRLLGRGMGVAFLDTREPWPLSGHDSVILDIAKPTPAEQRAAWQQALGSDSAAARLAAQFNLNVAEIATLAARGRSLTAKATVPPQAAAALERAVWRECLSQARPAMNQLAQPVQPKAQWDDLELPEADKALLRQIADQVAGRTTVYDDWGFRRRMNRGLGISALFAGESGTGKTMAAEVLAGELDLLLYRIDLSAVVSKYIGETEKNLRTLFDTAEDGGAILFFDEADALFGKRSEVKDSHDRYANIEVNYLLQRMESYGGLAILATNTRSALDTAFVRRLRFIVNFPFPGVAQRVAMWQRIFPSQVPLGELDYPRLGRLNVSGGNIHNIAINAAFLAAHAGGRVTMPLVLEAARNEFRKMERPVNEADFRWLESAGGKA